MKQTHFLNSFLQYHLHYNFVHALFPFSLFISSKIYTRRQRGREMKSCSWMLVCTETSSLKVYSYYGADCVWHNLPNENARNEIKVICKWWKWRSLLFWLMNLMEIKKKTKVVLVCTESSALKFVYLPEKGQWLFESLSQCHVKLLSPRMSVH